MLAMVINLLINKTSDIKTNQYSFPQKKARKKLNQSKQMKGKDGEKRIFVTECKIAWFSLLSFLLTVTMHI